MEPPCRQLIVWDPAEEAILGGYRFITGNDIRFNSDGSPRIATSHMFEFSKEFIDNYLPYTIELGRSFVRLSISQHARSQGYLCARQLVGRTWGIDSGLSRNKVSVRQSYHVSRISSAVPKHDSLLPEEAFS